MCRVLPGQDGHPQTEEEGEEKKQHNYQKGNQGGLAGVKSSQEGGGGRRPGEGKFSGDWGRGGGPWQLSEE